MRFDYSAKGSNLLFYYDVNECNFSKHQRESSGRRFFIFNFLYSDLCRHKVFDE